MSPVEPASSPGLYHLAPDEADRPSVPKVIHHARRSPDRILSIDALRGFDMFWITGGEELFQAIGRWTNQPILVEQLEHVPWEGFRFYDLIYPLFLFIVGLVLPFSLTRIQETGGGSAAAQHRIFRRAFLLILLGLVYNGLLQFQFDNFRWPGVLQRIGICYFFAALIVLHSRAWLQATLAAAILFGYWAILLWIPAPGGVAGDLSPERNLAGYLDRTWLPGKLCCYGYGDNEGILSTLPAIGTTLLGALAGHWLRLDRRKWVTLLGLVAAAAACLAAGWYWGRTFPIIKNLWTSSFVLVSAGYSLALLAFFYLVIDVLKFRRWAFFFIVIGVNPITIYLMQRFVNFEQMSAFFLGGAMRFVPPAAAPVILFAGVIAVEWLFLLYLYRNKTFLRV